MSKIYEASTLLSAMEQRLTEYKALEEQLLAVKTEFEVIVHMEDELQGEGAKAIKNFFQAQAKVVDAWVDFISMQTSFLSAISGDMEEASLSGNTFIQESFLEQECLNGLTNAITMTMAQREELQSIFHRIDDILPLEMYDAEPFYEKMGDAGKERTATETALNKLDEQWKQEYQHSEASQSNVFGLLGELMKASSQGGTVSPMSFDEQAFHDSEIYQLQGEMKKYTDEYVQFKDEQADTREQVKKAKEMEARPWYEKTWDTVSAFTGEITGYYDYKRASEGIDPVTGEKLSDAQRIAAGAMAAAGFIPVVGWAGRAAKGGSAIYKTTKGMNAAAHTLDAYKSAKSFDVLQKTEMGIYGLVAANGLSEYMNGTDMFGNELTEEQRQNSLYSALGIAGVAGAAKYIDHLQVKNAPFETSRANTNSVIREMSEADRKKLDNWAYPPNNEKYIKYKEVYDNPKYYDQETGNINWPPNNGFKGEPVPMELKKDMLLDRYGGPQGNFFSQEGVPYEQRALALHSDEADYYVYKVLEDFEAVGGEAAPWFDRPGGGVQFIKYHDNGKMYTMEELVRDDLIELVRIDKYESK